MAPRLHCAARMKSRSLIRPPFLLLLFVAACTVGSEEPTDESGSEEISLPDDETGYWDVCDECETCLNDCDRAYETCTATLPVEYCDQVCGCPGEDCSRCSGECLYQELVWCAQALDECYLNRCIRGYCGQCGP